MDPFLLIFINDLELILNLSVKLFAKLYLVGDKHDFLLSEFFRLDLIKWCKIIRMDINWKKRQLILKPTNVCYYNQKYLLKVYKLKFFPLFILPKLG